MTLKYANIFLVFLLLIGKYSYGTGKDKSLPFSISYFKDKSNELTMSDVSKMHFTQSANKNVLNLGVANATFWIKLVAKEDIKRNNSIFFIEQSRFAEHQLYSQKFLQNQQNVHQYTWFNNNNVANSLGISYKLPDLIQKGQAYYLKLRPYEALIAKINIIDEPQLLDNYALRDIVFGMFSGVMLIMFVYNLFLYIVVRDSSYMYYVFYILFTWLTQISIQGFGSKYLWDAASIIDGYSVVLFSLLGLLFAILFTISFLNTKIFAPGPHKLFHLLLILIIINITILLLFDNYIAFIIMQVLIILSVILALFTSHHVYFKKHFKPAGFYLIAWSVLLIGAVMFILKDYNIIPYNTFTTYLLQISSGIEVTLLSFALADKINYFKKENEIAQAQALNASLENQKLIKEQNVFLEIKVRERTEELENANDTLNTTLSNLKSAQSQLVDSEKMAALGQLTAGIAHEINNPINFVTSNVKPLQLDIDDLKDIIKKYEDIDLSKEIAPQIAAIESYKKQIDVDFINKEIVSLLAGISEGAKRTAEIIRSLRNFSRLDETDMKAIDLNEGLLSTLVLVRNNLPDNLTVVKDLGNLPQVECMPGKINQIFMNLISNAIQAIKSKEIQAEEEFLTIRSWYNNQQVFVSIKDTGTGMTEEVKQKIFEPFFTTKDIGEGTGLGLSIVFSIIEKHNGHVEVISEVGKGTEFIITLHVNIL